MSWRTVIGWITRGACPSGAGTVRQRTATTNRRSVEASRLRGSLLEAQRRRGSGSATKNLRRTPPLGNPCVASINHQLIRRSSLRQTAAPYLRIFSSVVLTDAQAFSAARDRRPMTGPSAVVLNVQARVASASSSCAHADVAVVSRAGQLASVPPRRKSAVNPITSRERR